MMFLNSSFELFLSHRKRKSKLLSLPYRHVILPKDMKNKISKDHLMTETEWRNLGVQQSPGWVHYLIHQPGKLINSYLCCQLLHEHYLKAYHEESLSYR